jgi:hypothetical protein
MASAKTIGQRATVLAASVAAIMGVTVGTNLLIVKGTTSTVRVESTGVIVASGGLLPIEGNLTLTEVNQYASGALSITNPYDETLLCENFVLDITTNSSPPSNLDIYLATGALASNGKRGSNTGSTIVMNNWPTLAGLFTASGSGIVDSVSNPKFFKLYGSSSTTNVNRINIVSLNQTGSLLAGTYHLYCHFEQ